MDLIEFIIITLQIADVFTKKYASSSDESIENLLYYKDCQRKAREEPTEAPMPLRGLEPPKRQPDCPFPKMCCSLSCGNDCDSNPQSFVSRQMEPLQQPMPMMKMKQPSPPRQPELLMQSKLGQRGRNKKLNSLSSMLPIGGRRDIGFTKERIKSLISQDDDIRKILKDLVRVTMQKVDLLELINNKNKAILKTSDISKSDDDYES